MHVVHAEHEAAHPDGREIDDPFAADDGTPVHFDVAIDAQARDTPIRKDVETQMRPGPAVMNLEQVRVVALGVAVGITVRLAVGLGAQVTTGWLRPRCRPAGRG